MRKILLGTLFIGVAAFLIGCLTSPVQGILFTGTTHHVIGQSAGNQIGPGRILRKGESCSASTWLFSINFFYYGGGGSIAEAAREAGITKIAVIDKTSTNILGPLYYQECVVVWGE